MYQHKNIAYSQSMNYLLTGYEKRQQKKEKKPHCWNNFKINYQNGIEDAQTILLRHKYITVHFPGTVHVLQ